MSDAPVKKGRGRPAKAKVEAPVEKSSPKKPEKVVKEVASPPAKEAPAKEENGAKKGRGRPPKGASAAKKPAPKRAAPAASGKGRGRPPKAKKQESADESADADSDS